MKGPKPNKTDHTPNTKIGMGEFKGTGVKNPIMRPKEIMGMKPIGKKTMGKAPKSMA